jgi:hypothetical protein
MFFPDRCGSLGRSACGWENGAPIRGRVTGVASAPSPSPLTPPPRDVSTAGRPRSTPRRSLRDPALPWSHRPRSPPICLRSLEGATLAHRNTAVSARCIHSHSKFGSVAPPSPRGFVQTARTVFPKGTKNNYFTRRTLQSKMKDVLKTMLWYFRGFSLRGKIDDNTLKVTDGRTAP